MSEKEPGQIAAEAWSGLGWEMLHESARERFRRTEAAVREDERRNVIKEAVAVFENSGNLIWGFGAIIASIRALQTKSPGREARAQS